MLCLIFVSLIFNVVFSEEIPTSELEQNVDGQIIDLSWGFNSQTQNWPTGRRFQFVQIQASYINDTWFASNSFCMPEHIGTHMDAPYHYNPSGWKVGDIPIERFIASAAVLDVTDKVQDNPNFLLQISDLEEWTARNGPFKPNTVIIVQFGWSKFYFSRESYFGVDAAGYVHYPGLSVAAAEWIAFHPNIVGVAIDTPSGDSVNNNIYESAPEKRLVHKALLSKNVYLIEGLKILRKLPAIGGTFIAMPMKITEGSGAPTRIIFVLPNEKIQSGTPRDFLVPNLKT